jgi:hypothetical protein
MGIERYVFWYFFSRLVAPLLVMVELISRNSLPLLLLYLYALLLFGLLIGARSGPSWEGRVWSASSAQVSMAMTVIQGTCLGYSTRVQLSFGVPGIGYLLLVGMEDKRLLF